MLGLRTLSRHSTHRTGGIPVTLTISRTSTSISTPTSPSTLTSLSSARFFTCSSSHRLCSCSSFIRSCPCSLMSSSSSSSSSRIISLHHRSFTTSSDPPSSSSSAPPSDSTTDSSSNIPTNAPPTLPTSSSISAPASIVDSPTSDPALDASSLTLEEQQQLEEQEEEQQELEEEDVDVDVDEEVVQEVDEDGNAVPQETIPSGRTRRAPRIVDPIQQHQKSVAAAQQYVQDEESIEWLQKQPISSIKESLSKLRSDPFYQKWLRGKQLESTYPERLEQHFEREDYRLTNRVWPAVPVVEKGQLISATPTQRALHAERVTSIDDYLTYYRSKTKIDRIRNYRNLRKIGTKIPDSPDYDWVRNMLQTVRDDLERNPNWTSEQKAKFISMLHPRLLNHARDAVTRREKAKAEKAAAIAKAEAQAKALAEANARDEQAKQHAKIARAQKRAGKQATPPPASS